jgi:hypothetical protein
MKTESSTTHQKACESAEQLLIGMGEQQPIWFLTTQQNSCTVHLIARVKAHVDAHLLYVTKTKIVVKGIRGLTQNS